MNRTLILLLSGVLTSAWPGGAAADGQSDPGDLRKLVAVFSFLMPHVTVPQHVVASEKDSSIVKDGEAKHAAPIESDKQLREAAQHVAERERELHLAREAFRQETSRVTQGPEPAAGEDPLELAARRMSQREQEAYRAKLEYGRVARAVREQRRRDEASAYAGL